MRKNIWILCRQHHCSWWCSRLDWLMQKQELNTKARKTHPPQKKTSIPEARHGSLPATQSKRKRERPKLPLVRNRNGYGTSSRMLQKVVASQKFPITNFGPWSKLQTCNWKPRILRIQSRTLNCNPPLQSRTSGCNQPRAAYALFYRKQSSFHCKPKPLIANPPSQLRGFEACNWGFHMFLLLPTTKYFIASRNPWLQAKILNCKPKPLIATPPLQLRIWN